MSFGLSRGRRLDGAEWSIDQSDLPSYDGTRLDPRAWFPHPERPFELEIGSGKGTFLLQESALRPEVNFLGIEWAGEFHRYAADRLRRRGVANVRLLRADATEFIRFRCPDAIASTLHLYFSDPWPKARHHKRRVVQDHTLREFHRLLVPRGELRLVTDHDELWAWYEEHAERHAALFERAPFERPASAGSEEVVGTNFERKYRREGRPFHAMTLVAR
ncbi:MAG TPA: tRNA (guanosine(46)-N7)-methyltransferase TrmB [Phycisphaerales bacterium]|nr:tRNA (guanosine(46)-N7)-methyltransferase TrmB [Phycisphaerales bacterium]HMP36256.1 tRNA (guanosine(46)-N7)-methyltransferase TrmB [Phycisphaerales bacterium]